MDADYFSRRSLSAERPLPSPSDTPYATPSTRLSSYGSPPSSNPLTPPPPLPPGAYNDEKDNGVDSSPADFDPAHFTPTLHASLVQQILSLRRELDSKQDFIEDLESTLASARSDNDALQSNLKRTGKETRALKRELQLHEDGTLSAMEVLAKERDDGNEANVELRRRLETSQKRLRSQEEDNLKYKSAFDVERQKWSTEKRLLERRAQLAEQRLTAVVHEVAVREAESLENSHVEDSTSAGAKEDTQSDTASIRSVQAELADPLQSRYSIDSVKKGNTTLADELDFSEQDDGPDSQRTSPLLTRQSLSIDRSASRSSLQAASMALTGIASHDFADQDGKSLGSQDGKKNKVLGLVSSFENQMRSVVKEQERSSSLVAKSQSAQAKLLLRLGAEPDAIVSVVNGEKSLEQADMARQVRGDISSLERLQLNGDIDQNERLRRRPRTKSDPLPLARYILLDLPIRRPSPPASPDSFASAGSKADLAQAPFSARLPSNRPETSSAGTQTDPTQPAESQPTPHALESAAIPPEPSRPPPPPPAPTRQPPPIPTKPVGVVPAIAIHPPDHLAAAPLASGRTLRSVGTQTSFKSRLTSKSTGMQTELIKIDKRRFKNLLPSALLEQARSSMEQKRSISEPTQNSTDVLRAEKDGAVDQDDNLASAPLPPLAELDDDPAPTVGTRKSLYSSPPLVTSDDKALDFEELDDLNLSDIEYGTNLSSAKISQKLSRHSGRSFAPPAPVPENEKVAQPLYTRSRLSVSSRGSTRSSVDKGKRYVPSLNVEALNQYQARHPHVVRGSAIESRSPSMSSGFSSTQSKAGGPRPPFAIPSRKSSRDQYAKIRYFRPTAQPPTPSWRGGRSSPPAISRGESQKLTKKPPQVLRKARSAVTLDNSRPSDTLGEPASLGYTRVTRIGQPTTTPPNNVAYENKSDAPNSTGQVARISTMFPTGSATAFSSMQYSVVDAITATTIGEWMFKYVRKRKSFGVTEGDANNERHKRWVWLSPYDRTVMWSTKQPATNTALMGKNGRKLTIQSVLDVKDDTPAPKEARSQGVFNRSILVLTPARALKFTAVSRDRHYLWLTALSFLAHHNDRNAPQYSFKAPEPSFQDSNPSSGRSRASSFKNPLRATKQPKGTPDKNSGPATPVAPAASKGPDVGATAFAPSVPRVPHSRKRSMTGPSRGRTASSIFGGLSSAQTSTSRLSASNSSARVQSVGGASTRRSLRPQEEDMAFFERGLDATRHQRLNASPRLSVGDPDFGGNTNFFDAVGVTKLDAFVRPGLTVPAKGLANGGSQPEWRGHTRKASSGTFIGPPDIARARTVRRAGTLRGREGTLFGF